MPMICPRRDIPARSDCFGPPLTRVIADIAGTAKPAAGSASQAQSWLASRGSAGSVISWSKQNRRAVHSILAGCSRNQGSLRSVFRLVSTCIIDQGSVRLATLRFQAWLGPLQVAGVQPKALLALFDVSEPQASGNQDDPGSHRPGTMRRLR